MVVLPWAGEKAELRDCLKVDMKEAARHRHHWVPPFRSPPPPSSSHARGDRVCSGFRQLHVAPPLRHSPSSSGFLPWGFPAAMMPHYIRTRCNLQVWEGKWEQKNKRFPLSSFQDTVLRHIFTDSLEDSGRMKDHLPSAMLNPIIYPCINFLSFPVAFFWSPTPVSF